MKKLVIHVGMHKTGSTTLQTTLFENAIRLRKEKVFFPEDTACNHGRVMGAIFMDYLIERPLQKAKILHSFKGNREVKTRKFKSYWEIKFDEFHKSDCDTFIISSETFFRLSRPGIEEFKSFLSRTFDSIEVIAYIRNPQEFIDSMFSQMIKMGVNTIDELYQFQYFYLKDILAALKNYIDVFGKRNVHIRAFSRERLYNNDIIDDFLYTVFGRIDFSIKRVRDKNVSLSLSANKIVSQYNKTTPALLENCQLNTKRPNVLKLLEIDQCIIDNKDNIKVPVSLNTVFKINKDYSKIDSLINDGYRFKKLVFNPFSYCQLKARCKYIPVSYVANMVKEYEEILRQRDV
jgi:hypothetical protein